MSDNYPPITPVWAASIWATDAWLYLELPGTKGATKHTVRFPLDPKGLARALQVLKHRTSESRIGEKGDPTRHRIDKELKYNEKMVRRVRKDTFSDKARMAAREALRKVGIL